MWVELGVFLWLFSYFIVYNVFNGALTFLLPLQGTTALLPLALSPTLNAMPDPQKSFNKCLLKKKNEAVNIHSCSATE